MFNNSMFNNNMFNNLQYRNSNRIRNRVINSYLNNIVNNNRQINSMLELMKNNEQILASLINDEFNLNETENSNNLDTNLNNNPNVNSNTSPNIPPNTSLNTPPNNDINNLNNILNLTRENIFNSNLDQIFSNFSNNLNEPNNLNENNIYTRHFIIRNPSAYSFFNNDDADFLTPIVIRPTQEQINNATEECIFSSIIDPPNSSCPISLVPFQNNDMVYKIKQCGHIFFKNQLENWLLENTKCPLCRYDIRDYQNY
jgi:hypothetical protein